MIETGKAVVHDVREDKTLRWFGGEMLWPTVIRLVNYVQLKISRAPAQWSKRGTMIRDGYTCAYQIPGTCKGTANTVDHIFPVSRGGVSSWSNTIASCFECNNYKDDKTPEEAGLTLRIQPWTPTKAHLAILSK